MVSLWSNHRSISGKVYKGELTQTNGERLFVAVKALKENASAKTQADFKREIELISDLKHDNIVCILGVVLNEEPLCMLFEYMTQGDLHEFLIANSPNETAKSSSSSSSTIILSQLHFLHIAMQICDGMEYLASHHYVHRDLAARNCLVGDQLTVKISDFGLSRDIYSSDYYRVQSKSLLPVRWMPSESILYGKFTTESDVWSFGVVLWEIYSFGLQVFLDHFWASLLPFSPHPAHSISQIVHAFNSIRTKSKISPHPAILRLQQPRGHKYGASPSTVALSRGMSYSRLFIDG